MRGVRSLTRQENYDTQQAMLLIRRADVSFFVQYDMGRVIPAQIWLSFRREEKS